MACSPDSWRVASGSRDTTIRIWNAVSGAKLAALREHESQVTSVSCSSDGQRIVSGSRDTTVRVWDAVSGAGLAVLRGHESLVKSVSYSEDSRKIISSSWDNTMRVWDGETHQVLDVIQGSHNVASVVMGASSALPWRAVNRDQEIVIEPVRCRDVVARFPVALRYINSHPNGHVWAGAFGNHLYIITLEGEGTL